MIADIENLSFPSPKGFLVIEGLNGAGKTTLQKKIVSYLEERQFPVLSTFEPGATRLGWSLRRMLLETDLGGLSPYSEVFLFAADRANHVALKIKPALAEGTVVVSDRYFYSTLAFQGYGRELDLKAISQINEIAVNGILPDMIILLDVAPEDGLGRTQKRPAFQAKKDNFEELDLSFHRRLRQGFKQIAENCKEPFIVIDAAQPEEAVWELARQALESWVQTLDKRKAP